MQTIPEIIAALAQVQSSMIPMSGDTLSHLDWLKRSLERDEENRHLGIARGILEKQGKMAAIRYVQSYRSSTLVAAWRYVKTRFLWEYKVIRFTNVSSCDTIDRHA